MRVPDFSAENRLLHPGDQLHCPHCRHWHPVAAMHSEGTEYTRLMLFWQCGGGQYYAGQIGTQIGHLQFRNLRELKRQGSWCRR